MKTENGLSAAPVERLVSVRRWVWRLAYPFCRAANKLFGLSYLWVNVGIAAWHRESFDALWHHQWFGDPIAEMPESVILCGIRYRVSVAEGLVQFINADCGTGESLRFERDPHDRYGFLWYYDGTRVAASHFEQAYEWIKAVYGGSHEVKRPALSR
jgi:hypothetical protein